MYENSTGDSPFKGGGTRTITSNTNLQEARSKYYEVPYDKSGAPAKDFSRQANDDGNSGRTMSPRSASYRYSIRQWATAAKKAADRLAEAVEEDDFMEATGSGVELTNQLRELWRLRDSRESEFAEIINMLEIALAKVQFETLSSSQCRFLCQLIDQYVVAGMVDETDVRDARSLLRQAGLDPWRGLSLRED